MKRIGTILGVVLALGAGVSGVRAQPTFTRAEFIAKVDDGTMVAGALRLVFSEPITDAGTADSYELRLNGAEATGFSLSNPTIDGDDVVLDVTAPAGNGVAADAKSILSFGFSPAGDFSVIVDDEGTTPPASAGGAFVDSTERTALDEIDPSLLFVAFGDFDGDGHQDSAFLVFDEPVNDLTNDDGFDLTTAAAAVRPFLQVAADGSLVTDNTVAGTTIAITSVSRVDVGVDSGAPFDTGQTPRTTGNAIQVAYNPLVVNWDNSGATPTGSASEAIPGNGDANVVQVEYDVSEMTITDAASNLFDNGGSDVDQLTMVDRAAPVVARALFFAGENQPNNSDNQQSFVEVDATPGDVRTNDRVQICFGEEIASINAATLLEAQITFASGASMGGFSGDADFLFVDSNSLTLKNTAGSALLGVGSTLTVRPASLLSDDDGVLNAATGTVVVTDRRAPYLSRQNSSVGVVHSAFLVDDDTLPADAGFGFADRVRIKMTQPINLPTVQAADFLASLGTINNAATDNADAATIILTLDDGVVSMSNTIEITYRGTVDGTLIASTAGGGGTGVAVSALDATFTAQALPGSGRPTQNVAIMDIVGTLTLDGATAAPLGSRVIGFVASPAVNRIIATHNGQPFIVDENYDRQSLTALTNWFYGLKPFVYLHRTSGNFQFYRNEKSGDFTDNDGDPISPVLGETIALIFNVRALDNITFTGRGETSQQTISGGSLNLCWDVLRSVDGTIEKFYALTPDGGYVSGGPPILSSAVVSTSDGRYELHHSAPISTFDGSSRLSAIDRPVILVAETTDGQRRAVSSVLTSLQTGAAPILFRVQNRTQTSGNANNAVTYNINLNNIGMEFAHVGWNLVAFNRLSGFATAASQRPVLQSGVTNANIALGPGPVFASPLEQWVYFHDNNGDSLWTSGDDGVNGEFSGIVADADCLQTFSFTMTSFGPQIGGGISNLVGGYAVGTFNFGSESIGIFQFGAMLTGNVIFAASPSFPNTTATQGWTLVTSRALFSPATLIRSTNNPKLDYVILFRNNGPNPPSGRPTIEVSSLDLVAPSGSDNANDTTVIDAGQAFFGHFTP